MNHDEIRQQLTHARALVSFLEGLLGESTAPETEDEVSRALRRLVHSKQWPPAIAPSLLCDPNSDEEKIRRGTGIIDRLLDRLLGEEHRVLDFGCGEGHTAYAAHLQGVSLSVGYDAVDQGWCRFLPEPGLILTTDLDEVRSRGPYDVVLLCDVLDHCEEEPASVLAQVAGLLTSGGRAYVRCHPWSSRHGGHGYHEFNRAFCHLVFPEDTLREMGWNGLSGRLLTEPLAAYRKWFKAAGFRVVSERPEFEEVEKFFQIPRISQRLQGLENSLSFVDYTLVFQEAE